MSYFIFYTPSHFFKEMPPVSNVTPLPTRAVQGAPGRPPRYSATMSPGETSLPFPTARTPPPLPPRAHPPPLPRLGLLPPVHPDAPLPPREFPGRPREPVRTKVPGG